MNTLTTTEDASAAADFLRCNFMHVHRGVVDGGDEIVVFGNDGYSTDRRSQREVELVVQRLKQLEIIDPEFGLDSGGVTWALLIRNYDELEMPIDAINRMVWDAWFAACEEKQNGK